MVISPAINALREPENTISEKASGTASKQDFLIQEFEPATKPAEHNIKRIFDVYPNTFGLPLKASILISSPSNVNTIKIKPKITPSTEPMAEGSRSPFTPNCWPD